MAPNIIVTIEQPTQETFAPQEEKFLRFKKGCQQVSKIIQQQNQDLQKNYSPSIAYSMRKIDFYKSFKQEASFIAYKNHLKDEPFHIKDKNASEWQAYFAKGSRLCSDLLITSDEYLYMMNVKPDNRFRDALDNFRTKVYMKQEPSLAQQFMDGTFEMNFDTFIKKIDIGENCQASQQLKTALKPHFDYLKKLYDTFQTAKTNLATFQTAKKNLAKLEKMLLNNPDSRLRQAIEQKIAKTKEILETTENTETKEILETTQNLVQQTLETIEVMMDYHILVHPYQDIVKNKITIQCNKLLSLYQQAQYGITDEPLKIVTEYYEKKLVCHDGIVKNLKSTIYQLKNVTLNPADKKQFLSDFRNYRKHSIQQERMLDRLKDYPKDVQNNIVSMTQEYQANQEQQEKIQQEAHQKANKLQKQAQKQQILNETFSAFPKLIETEKTQRSDLQKNHTALEENLDNLKKLQQNIVSLYQNPRTSQAEKQTALDNYNKTYTTIQELNTGYQTSIKNWRDTKETVQKNLKTLVNHKNRFPEEAFQALNFENIKTALQNQIKANEQLALKHQEIFKPLDVSFLEKTHQTVTEQDKQETQEYIKETVATMFENIKNKEITTQITRHTIKNVVQNHFIADVIQSFESLRSDIPSFDSANIFNPDYSIRTGIRMFVIDAVKMLQPILEQNIEDYQQTPAYDFMKTILNNDIGAFKQIYTPFQERIESILSVVEQGSLNANQPDTKTQRKEIFEKLKALETTYQEMAHYSQTTMPWQSTDKIEEEYKALIEKMPYLEKSLTQERDKHIANMKTNMKTNMKIRKKFITQTVDVMLMMTEDPAMAKLKL